MILHPASDEALYLEITLDVDPAAATLTVSVDGGPFEAWAWTGAATQSGALWTRTGRRQYRGPDADPSTSPLLTLGRHTVVWRPAGIDPEKPARSADPIYVQA